MVRAVPDQPTHFQRCRGVYYPKTKIPFHCQIQNNHNFISQSRHIGAIFRGKRKQSHRHLDRKRRKTSKISGLKTIMLPCTNVNTEAAASKETPTLYVNASLVTVIVFWCTQLANFTMTDPLFIANLRLSSNKRRAQDPSRPLYAIFTATQPFEPCSGSVDIRHSIRQIATCRQLSEPSVTVAKQALLLHTHFINICRFVYK